MTSPANDASDFSQHFATACAEANAMFSSYLGAATKSGSAAWQGLDDMMKNAGSFMQESCNRAVDACKSLMSAKSPQEAAEHHAEYLKECFDNVVAGSSRMSEISLRAAKGAIDPLAQHTNDAVSAFMKKAKAA